MNPILKRELNGYMRSPGTSVIVAGQIIILSFVLFLLWPRYEVFSMVNSRGKELFSVFLLFNLACVILIAPTFTATAITKEREQRSFDMLFTTLLTPFQILSGKLFASLGMLLIVIFISAPITAVCSLSGGIDLELLLKAYGIILLSGITYGVFGLAISAICDSSFTANMSAYFGVAFLVGVTWLPSVLFSHIFFLKPFLDMLSALSPITAMFALIYPERYGIAMNNDVGVSPLMRHTFGMLSLSFIFLCTFCIFIFRKQGSATKLHVESYTGFKKSIKRKLSFPFYLIDPLKRKKPIGRFRNPVFVTELRSKIFGSPKFILRGVSASIIISMLILIMVCMQYGSTIKADNVRMVAVIFQIGMIALLAPVVSSGSITNELTSGTFLLLKTSTIGPLKVVIGKLKAAFLYVMIFLISSLPVILALTYLESKSSYWRIIAWLAVLILSSILFISAGLAASAFNKKTEIATALSYGFALLVCVVTLGACIFSDQLTIKSQCIILTFNPIVAALQITSNNLFNNLPKIMGLELWQNHLIIVSALSIFFIIASAFRVNWIFTKRD